MLSLYRYLRTTVHQITVIEDFALEFLCRLNVYDSSYYTIIMFLRILID